MDINKILSLNIPDIHPTYGGVRGKNMSSRSQGDRAAGTTWLSEENRA